MSINAAQLTDEREPIYIAGERSFLVQDGVVMDYLTGNGYPGQGHHYFSPKGKIFLTNRRVIYVPPRPQAFFDTLTIPLPNLQEGKLIQPWWGANRYEAVCVPVPNGGLPLPGSVTWTFKEGGAFEFSTMFRQLKSRLDEVVYQQSEDDFLPEYAAPPAVPPPEPATQYEIPPPADASNNTPPVFLAQPVAVSDASASPIFQAQPLAAPAAGVPAQPVPTSQAPANPTTYV
ncbi:hypothetical protein HDU96_005738 [Phlyctochytrium bullatum]|nr:hypothetical protein HDU96_005738 [Phlyctochytrium bullatum]